MRVTRRPPPGPPQSPPGAIGWKQALLIWVVILVVGGGIAWLAGASPGAILAFVPAILIGVVFVARSNR